jgi:hypothetical protein
MQAVHIILNFHQSRTMSIKRQEGRCVVCTAGTRHASQEMRHAFASQWLQFGPRIMYVQNPAACPLLPLTWLHFAFQVSPFFPFPIATPSTLRLSCHSTFSRICSTVDSIKVTHVLVSRTLEPLKNNLPLFAFAFTDLSERLRQYQKTSSY